MTFQALLYTFISSAIALFPVLNPIGNGFIVNGFLYGMTEPQRRAAAKKIFINCLLIGVGSLLAGQIILLLFGLAVPVIQVGGGIVICITGYQMLSNPDTAVADAAETSVHDEMKKVGNKDMESKLFYPLSFPMCMGPGSISVIFTLMATASVKGDWLYTGINYAMIAAAIAGMVVLLYIFILSGPRITQKLGKSGNMIINKLIAFITFCIGIQILVTGISRIFHLTIL